MKIQFIGPLFLFAILTFGHSEVAAAGSPFDFVYNKSQSFSGYDPVTYKDVSETQFQISTKGSDDYLYVNKAFSDKAVQFVDCRSKEEAHRLVQDGLDPMMKDANGNSLIALAIYNNIWHLEKLTYLLDLANGLPFSDQTVSAQLMDRFFYEFRDRLYCIDNSSRSESEKASAIEEFTKIFKLMVSKGVKTDVTWKAWTGRIETPLQVATEWKFSEIQKMIHDLQTSNNKL